MLAGILAYRMRCCPPKMTGGTFGISLTLLVGSTSHETLTFCTLSCSIEVTRPITCNGKEHLGPKSSKDWRMLHLYSELAWLLCLLSKCIRRIGMQSLKVLTLCWILSCWNTISERPLPALATPLMRALDAPWPMPTANTRLSWACRLTSSVIWSTFHTLPSEINKSWKWEEYVWMPLVSF